jgi:hypothetical protein
VRLNGLDSSEYDLETSGLDLGLNEPSIGNKSGYIDEVLSEVVNLGLAADTDTWTWAVFFEYRHSST